MAGLLGNLTNRWVAIPNQASSLLGLTSPSVDKTLTGGDEAQGQGGLLGGVTGAVGKTVDGVGNATGQTLDGVGNAAGQTTQGVGNVAGGATNAAGGLVGGATGSGQQPKVPQQQQQPRQVWRYALFWEMIRNGSSCEPGGVVAATFVYKNRWETNEYNIPIITIIIHVSVN